MCPMGFHKAFGRLNGGCVAVIPYQIAVIKPKTIITMQKVLNAVGNISYLLSTFGGVSVINLPLPICYLSKL